jgi:hypothetical protein
MISPTNETISVGEVKSVIFEKMMLAFTTIIPEYPAIGPNAKVDVRELSYAVDQLALYVRSWVLDGHKVDRTETESIDFPATPWDFWKQEYAPKWFLNRWPVKMKTTVVNKNIHKHYVCPHVNVRNDDSMHFMWMARMKECKV